MTMASPSGLVGKRVQLIIDEDGTRESPVLPPGTIMRQLTGPDRDDYFLVHLDNPVECQRASDGTRWTLRNLIVATRLEGDSLDDISDRKRAKKRDFAREQQNMAKWSAMAGVVGVPSKERWDFVHVAISNVLSPLDENADRFDLDQVEYFALGRAMRVE